MGRKTIVLLSVILFIFAALFAGTYVFVASKIEPENVERQLEKALGELFPNGQVAVGSVTYSLGFSVYVRIENIEVGYRDSPLFELADISVSVPLWNILRGGGTIGVSVVEPHLYYRKRGNRDGWSQAMGTPSQPKQGKEDVEGGVGWLASLPFVASGKVDVDFQNLRISYSLDGREGKVVVERLSLKDIGLHSSLSFKLDSSFALDLFGEGDLSFRLGVLGQTDFKTVRARSEIGGIVLRGSAYKFAKIDNEVDLALEERGRIRGNSRLGYGGTTSLDFRFDIGSGNIRLEDVVSSLSVEDILATMDEGAREGQWPVWDVRGGPIVIRPDKESIEVKNMRLKSGDGTVRFKAAATAHSMDFDARLKDVALEDLSFLIPKDVGRARGSFGGSVGGKVGYGGKRFSHDISVDVSAEDGSIEKMDISKWIKDVLAKLPAQMGNPLGNRTIEASPDFHKFLFKARLRNERYDLREITFVGFKDRVEIGGRGTVYPSGGAKGEILLNYRDPSGSLDRLLKDTGQKALPLRFEGTGLALSPDYGYTVGKLTKNRVKSEAKKGIRRAVKKGVEKLIKGEKFKKLLDGLL